MTTVSFFGSLLVAFGPFISLFCFVVAPMHKRVVFMLASCFFSLIGISCSALLWYILSPLQETYGAIIFWSVLIQEALRYAYVRTYRFSAKGIARLSRNLVLGPPTLGTSASSGIGFGMMYGLVMYVPVLANATGPGTLFSEACPKTDLFFLSSIYTLGMSLMLMLTTIMAFEAYIGPLCQKTTILIVLSHLSASYFSMLNLDGGSCVAGLVLLFVVVLLDAVYVYRYILSSEQHANPTILHDEQE
eukprot:TRINITY_DN6298_c0_g1_i3.p1 TRINITY_DN6298_c0_g1~~TRINITY_DN6298_c0_g1_i3.p1  ORF type:complete len:246 (+),score=44.15 TRINITY_DN6298_c0_g1_i3:51-788(+)